MDIKTRKTLVKFSILLFEDGTHESVVTFYNTYLNEYNFKSNNVTETFMNLLEKMCYTEKNICKSEIMSFLRHNNYFGFRLDLDNIKVIVTYDRDSSEWISFHILDLENHNNIGFDHLYDDSEYLTTFKGGFSNEAF